MHSGLPRIKLYGELWQTTSLTIYPSNKISCKVCLDRPRCAHPPPFWTNDNIISGEAYGKVEGMHVQHYIIQRTTSRLSDRVRVDT